MDRPIIYPGAIPLETDLLFTNRAVMVALGKLAGAVLGTATQANGFACAPTAVPSLAVQVGPGEIYSLQSIDAAAYSSLAADTTHQVTKQGVALESTTLSCPAPSTSGHSVVYLIQAAFQEADTTPVVLPYYNASNPALGYSGPGGTGAAQNTRRAGGVVLSAKAGTSAPTGSQVAPSPDSGYIGLWTVTVANGSTSVSSGNIAAAAAAPTITSLSALSAIIAGMASVQVLSTSGTPDGFKIGALMVQFGKYASDVSGDLTNVAVTLPHAFPSAGLWAGVFDLNASGDNTADGRMVVKSLTASTLTATLHYAAGASALVRGFNWVAVGW